MSSRFVPVFIVVSGGAVGGLLGWFLSRLLVPEGSLGSDFLALLMAWCGAFVGLFPGVAAARWVVKEEPHGP
jgi:hypothetical protein